MAAMSGAGRLPRGVVTLGYAGLVPFVAGVLGIALLEGEPRLFAARALVAYGAVILSFLGAVHWGLLLHAQTKETPSRLLAAAVPSLAAWGALLLSSSRGLALLAVAFGVFWLYEHRVAGERLLPPGYLELRRQLTVAVCALLTLGMLALG
jgi:hypothetical protein